MADTIYQVLDRIEDDADPEPIPACDSSLAFLRAIYSDPAQPIHRRMRAAIGALPFEHPKLAVVASITGGEGFAARLEEAIARSGKVIEMARLLPGSKPADGGATD